MCEADVKKLRNNMDKEILLSNDLLNTKIELLESNISLLKSQNDN